MNKVYKRTVSIIGALLTFLFPCRAYGLERIPEGGVLFCGNHTTFLDPVYIVCLAGRKRQIHVLAKEELFRIPILGAVLKRMDMIPVRRGKSDMTAYKESLRVLRNGEPLLIFPEGTRVAEGEQVEAHTGAVVMAARSNVPIVPVHISKPRVRLFHRTNVYFGEPYFLTFEGKKPTPAESKKLSAELMANIHALGETK